MDNEASQAEQPDLIIGIDFGQTCTGVAYAHPRLTDTIRCIQRWPGRAQAMENKVPSALIYPHNQDRPSSWGFISEKSMEQESVYGQVRDWFKIMLDPTILESERKRDPDFTAVEEDIHRWFRDFFTCLYQHIKQSLSSELPNFEWPATNVEFLFSVPTTWNPQVVESFRKIISESGFTGPTSGQHGVTISLTEAEAAAVHVSTEIGNGFEEGEIIVVCDAGGGTTDLSALEIAQTAGGSPSLSQLRQVDIVGGEAIGSVAIDCLFEQLVEERLKRAESERRFGIDPVDAAWSMARSRDFQNVKCEHGAAHESPRFSVTVPQLHYDHVDEDACIRHGEMQFKQDDLRTLFDHQINKLFRLIDKQLKTLEEKLPHKQIAHLILSGGLGQSPYVQQRLIEYYRGSSGPYSNTIGMQVRVVPEPQLAVCKGLVANQLRKLRAGQGMLEWRSCRASYGLLCRELYTRKNHKHQGRTKILDPRDGKLYVDNSIVWFVEKGTPVSIDKPIVHDFRRKISPRDPCRSFPTRLVVSHVDKVSLPYVFEEGVVENLCEVEADLSMVKEARFKERNKRFWQPGEHYLLVEFQVQIVIGAADLRFELWIDGNRVSKKSSIKVEWAPAASPLKVLPPPPPHLPPGEDIVKRSKPRSRFNRGFSERAPERTAGT